jgi:hypothetical protein
MLALQKDALHYFFLGSHLESKAEAPHTYNDVYHALLQPKPSKDLFRQAKNFLDQQLARASQLDCELPAQAHQLHDWMQHKLSNTGQAYQAYLANRKARQPRRFFANKGEALLFLQQIEPTKRVDGSWLYGALQCWADNRCEPLIRTYLDELGNGSAQQNHVLLYQSLMAKEGIATATQLDDVFYLQGSIQLALGLLGQDYLPEVIGFNLGYEQLPLHLLISTFELDELGIDPYYFNVHITIDNADSGHARKAIDALHAYMPLFVQKEEFYRRVKNGYNLNNMGLSSDQMIQSLNLEKAVLDIFAKKAIVGKLSHGNYCRVAGQSVNQWLEQPNKMAKFVDALQQSNWIRRHEDPQHSRFWQAVASDQGVMYGVFSSAEQQIIHDWIAGDWLQSTEAPHVPRYRAAHQSKTITRFESVSMQQALHSEDPDVCRLANKLQQCQTNQQAFSLLMPFLSAGLHSSHCGLWATQQFLRLFNQRDHVAVSAVN